MVALKRVVIIIFHLIILLSWLTAAHIEDKAIIASVGDKNKYGTKTDRFILIP